MLTGFLLVPGMGQDAAPPSDDLEPSLPGDCNSDGRVNLTDTIFFLSFLFLGGTPAECLGRCDANGDGTVDLSDFTTLAAYLLMDPTNPPTLPIEICDGLDNDCNGEADEECTPALTYTVEVAWASANDGQEAPEGISGYRVYYGKKRRGYSNSIFVSRPPALLEHIFAGKTYFMAVTSVDARGMESELSGEISLLIPIPQEGDGPGPRSQP